MVTSRSKHFLLRCPNLIKLSDDRTLADIGNPRNCELKESVLLQKYLLGESNNAADFLSLTEYSKILLT